MKKSSKRIHVITAFAVMVFATTALLEARVVLNGKIYRSEGGTGSENIRFVIDSYSTPDEILALKRFMTSGDVEGFYKALRAMDKGQMQPPGTAGLNVHFNVAIEQPTEKGIRILLITDSRNVKPGQNSFLFLVAELNLDKNFNGDGRVHYVAGIKFPPEGGIDLDSYVTVPNQITNLHRVK
jgi:hypothetical protein